MLIEDANKVARAISGFEDPSSAPLTFDPTLDPWSDPSVQASANSQSDPLIDAVNKPLGEKQDVSPDPTAPTLKEPVPAPQVPAGRTQSASGDVNTREGFATAILKAEGLPTTQQNIAFMIAWQAKEGGDHTGATNQGGAFNPLNTTHGMPGSTSYNSVGVQNYTDFQQGLNATLNTLNLPYYTGILDSLRRSDVNGAVHALAASPWGSGDIGGVYSSVQSNYGQYANFGLFGGAQAQAIPRQQAATVAGPTAQRVIGAAKSVIGAAYVWGAEGPTVFDCSGFFWWSHKQAGIDMPRLTAAGYYGALQHITQAQARPGDGVAYYGPGGGIDHIAIYLGGGKIIDTASPQHPVSVRNLNDVGGSYPVASFLKVPGLGSARGSRARQAAQPANLDPHNPNTDLLMAPSQVTAGTPSVPPDLAQVAQLAQEFRRKAA